MVVAMDMNTTTENMLWEITAMLSPMEATMMPTSPQGSMPTPMMVADLPPRLRAPIPHPMNLVAMASRVTRTAIAARRRTKRGPRIFQRTGRRTARGTR